VSVSASIIHVVPPYFKSAPASLCGDSFEKPCSWEDGANLAIANDTILMRNGEYQINNTLFVNNITIMAESVGGVTIGLNDTWPLNKWISLNPFVFTDTTATVVGVRFMRLQLNAVIVIGIDSAVSFVDCSFFDFATEPLKELNPKYIPSTIIAGVGVYSEGSLNFLRCSFVDMISVQSGKTVLGLAIYLAPPACTHPVSLVISQCLFQCTVLQRTRRKANFLTSRDLCTRSDIIARSFGVQRGSYFLPRPRILPRSWTERCSEAPRSDR
jgi:hypothetical protein